MLWARGQVTVALLQWPWGGGAWFAGSTVIAMTSRLRAATLGSVLLGSLLVLGGCSAATQESGFDSGGAPDVGEFGDGSLEAPSVEEGNRAASDDAGFDTSGNQEGRSVITTGYLYLTVDFPLEAAVEAARITERAGGRVDGRTEYSPEAQGSAGAELLLRIPSSSLTDTLDELRALGEVEELSLSASDVTREVQDLDARITALSSSVERLLALQDAAATVEDLIALETAISDRQGQLESLEAQQRSLSDQVSLSTIRLTLGSSETAPVDEPDTFFSGLIAGWEALIALGSGLLVLLGLMIPWLVLLGLLGLVVLVIVRVVRRRRQGAIAPTATPD